MPPDQRTASSQEGKPRCGCAPWRAKVIPPSVAQPGTAGCWPGSRAPRPCSKPPLTNRLPASGAGLVPMKGADDVFEAVHRGEVHDAVAVQVTGRERRRRAPGGRLAAVAEGPVAAAQPHAHAAAEAGRGEVLVPVAVEVADRDPEGLVADRDVARVLGEPGVAGPEPHGDAILEEERRDGVHMAVLVEVAHGDGHGVVRQRRALYRVEAEIAATPQDADLAALRDRDRDVVAPVAVEVRGRGGRGPGVGERHVDAADEPAVALAAPDRHVRLRW